MAGCSPASAGLGNRDHNGIGTGGVSVKALMSSENRTAVIIGDPRSVFPNELAVYWRKQGWEPVIVTLPGIAITETDQGIPVINGLAA